MSFQLSTWAIKKPVPTIVIFFTLCIAGLISFFKLPINADPVINFPVVTVIVTQDGASPSDLENSVTQPIERAVSGLPGIRHINSTITDGMSMTIVEFNLTVDSNVATNDIREQIAQIRSELPQSIDEPSINRIDVEGGAILNYAIQSNNMSLTELSWFVDNTLSKSLLMVPGVQKISRQGGAQREIRVEVNPTKLEAMKLSIDSINQLLLDNSVNVAGGTNNYAGQQHTLRILGAKNDLDLLKQLKLPTAENGWLTLGEIANISDSHQEIKTISYLNGEPAIGFSIFRAKGSSDTEVEKGVVKALSIIEKENPNIQLKLVSSNVKHTVASYNATMSTLIEGAILTIIVVFFFLRNWRATLIAAVALPLSILPTFIVLLLLDYTLNSITLLALTLVIGILVDDAIVEIENIERYIEQGERPYIAALKASNAIGFVIIAITMTIVAVFLPVSFIGGFVGKYFTPFGITVSAAVLSSMFVARLVTPLMSAFLLLPKKEIQKQTYKSKTPTWIKAYISLLKKTLSYRKRALALACIFLFTSIGLVTTLPSGFLPTADVGITKINIEMPPGTTVNQNELKLQQIQKEIMDDPLIVDLFSISGAEDNSGIIAENKGQLLLNLLPSDQRDVTQQEFELSLIPILDSIEDIRYSFGNNNGTRDISLILTSDNPDILSMTAQKIRHEMAAINGVKNIQILEPMLRKEIRIIPKEIEAAKAGVSTQSIGLAVKTAMIGEINAKVAKFNLVDRQIPIKVLFAQNHRDDIDILEHLYINTANNDSIPLGSVADIVINEGPAKIERIARQRKVVIEASLEGITIGTALEQIADLPTMKSLPPEVRQIEYGDIEYMNDMFERFSSTMILSIMMVLAVLVVLFKDFVQPMTILVALPFSVGGAIIALLWYGAAIDLPVIIGILMLMGIVTKNSILLVEFIIEKERSGMNRSRAIIQAGKERVRPIIMTTIAMIAGMLPLVISTGSDASFRAPMAIAVIGGLLSSTLLSLLFVPVIYSYMDDFKQWTIPHLKKLTSVTDNDLKYSD